MDTTKNNKKILFVALACCLAICFAALVSSFANANETNDSEAKNEEVTKALIAGEEVSADDLDAIAQKDNEDAVNNLNSDETSDNQNLGLNGNSTSENQNSSDSTSSDDKQIKITINDKGEWGVHFDTKEVVWSTPNIPECSSPTSGKMNFTFYNQFTASYDITHYGEGGYVFGTSPIIPEGYSSSTDKFSPCTISSTGQKFLDYDCFNQNLGDITPYTTILFDATATDTTGTETTLLTKDTRFSLDYYAGKVDDKLKSVYDNGGEITITPSARAHTFLDSAQTYNNWYVMYDKTLNSAQKHDLSGNHFAAFEIFGENDKVTLKYDKDTTTETDYNIYNITASNNQKTSENAVYHYKIRKDSNYKPIAYVTWMENGLKTVKSYLLDDLTSGSTLQEITDSGGEIYFNYFNPSQTFTASARVTDFFTGENISDATVKVYQDSGLSTLLDSGTTNSSGYWGGNVSLNSSTPVWYVVSKDGYVTVNRATYITGSSENFVLSNMVFISGNLIDASEEKKPMANQTFGLWDVENDVVLQEGVSDENGHFELGYLPYNREVIFYAGDDAHYVHPTKFTLTESVDLVNNPITVYNIYKGTLKPSDEWQGKIVDEDENRVESVPLYEKNTVYRLEDDKTTLTFVFPATMSKTTYEYKVKPVAAPGYKFTGWTLPTTNDVTGDLTFTANFVNDQDVTIKYVAAEGGSVDPISETVAPTATEAKGSTATPNEGYVFLNWKDSDGKVVSTDAKFVPTKGESTEWQSTTYVANFTKAVQPATIKYVAAEGGSVSPVSEVVEQEATEAKGSTATPNEGYVFLNWKDSDGNVVSEDTTFVPEKGESTEWQSTTYVASFMAKSVQPTPTPDPGTGGDSAATATSTGSNTGTSTSTTTGDGNLYAIIALLTACAVAAGVVYYRKRSHK